MPTHHKWTQLYAIGTQRLDWEHEIEIILVLRGGQVDVRSSHRRWARIGVDWHLGVLYNVDWKRPTLQKVGGKPPPLCTRMTLIRRVRLASRDRRPDQDSRCREHQLPITDGRSWQSGREVMTMHV